MLTDMGRSLFLGFFNGQRITIYIYYILCIFILYIYIYKILNEFILMLPFQIQFIWFFFNLFSIISRTPWFHPESYPEEPQTIEFELAIVTHVLPSTGCIQYSQHCYNPNTVSLVMRTERAIKTVAFCSAIPILFAVFKGRNRGCL